MTWIKIEDNITEHPKFVALSPEGWTLWLHGLVYCSRNMTDGFIPTPILPRLSLLDDADTPMKELVSTGLWHAIDGGWAVHDYLKYQRSKAQVLGDREAAAERTRRARERRRAKSVTQVSRRDMSVSHGDVTALETETESETETTAAAASSASEVIHRHLVDYARAGKKRSPVGWARTVAKEHPELADLSGQELIEALEAKWPTRVIAQPDGGAQRTKDGDLFIPGVGRIKEVG